MEDLVTPSARPDSRFWAKQRVLLTGHTGFKGSWASLWLERMGAEVHGLALEPDQLPNLYSRLAPFARMQSSIADISDLAAVQRVVAEARPTLVLHMAAQPLVRRSYADPAATFATNITGTVNLLDALRSATSVRAILVVTTDKVYRNTDPGRRFAEDDCLGGHDPYSASKACAEIVTESYARSFYAKSNIAVATARAGNVVGGGDWSEDRLVPDVWRALHRAESLRLRYPDATRPWQHVLDSLSGYLVYLERLVGSIEVPKALNFGPIEQAAVTVGEIATAMADQLGLVEGWKQAFGEHPPEARTLALDPGLSERTIGWKSRLSSRAAVAWTAEWYRRFDAGDDARTLTNDQISAYEAIA